MLLSEREDELQGLRVSNSSLLEKITFLEKELQTVSLKTETLNHKLRDAENSLDEVYMMRKSEGTAMFQIERYKIDVQRLLEML
jgi:nanoRNase/pAp phosphatase (c-di-AMP/oligoRNAs hydrolase)